MIMRKLLNFFLHRSIAAKLAAMAIAGAVFMGLIAVTALLIARAELITERTEKAHAIVDAVWHMADTFKREADAGKMSADEAKARLFAASGAIRWENLTNYVFIFDTETGICVMNSGNPPLLGKDIRGFKDATGFPFFAAMLDIAKRQGEGTIRYVFPRGSVDKTPLDKVAYVRGFAPWNLTIASAEYMTDIDATFWAMTRTAAMVILILMLVSALIAWGITKSVVTPLSVLKTRMAGLSTGELHAPVAATDRPDEIGEMARTVQVFQSAMIETERLRAEQQELEKRQEQRRRADMSQLADGFEGAVGEIIEIVSGASIELEASAESLSRTAEQAKTLTSRVAAASAEASTNVHSVAAASEEMSSSVNEISSRVQDSARIAEEAVKQAQRTDARMTQLSEAAGRIGGTAPESVEGGVARQIALVGGVIVAPIVIGLPDFDHGIRHAHAITIVHMAGDSNALAGCLGRHQLRAPRVGAQQAIVEERPNRLRRAERVAAHGCAVLSGSNGVAALPPSTISQRQPSAHSGCVMSCA